MFAELIYSKCGVSSKPWDALLAQAPKRFYTSLSDILSLVLQMFLQQVLFGNYIALKQSKKIPSVNKYTLVSRNQG